MDPVITKKFSDLAPIAPLLGAAIGLIGVLITVTVTWLKDRNIHAQRLQVIDQATKYLEFWDKYYKSLTSASDSASREFLSQHLQLQLSGAGQFLTRELSRLQPQRNYVKRPLPTNRLRRWFLFYMPNRALTWVPRSIFYMYAITFTIGGLALPFVLPFQEQMSIGERFLMFFVGIVGGAIYIALGQLFVWPFRALANWIDNRPAPACLQESHSDKSMGAVA